MSSNSQLLEAVFEGLYSQHRLEKQFRVKLLDRQHIDVAGTVWKQYTDLYYLRLLGLFSSTCWERPY